MYLKILNTQRRTGKTVIFHAMTIKFLRARNVEDVNPKFQYRCGVMQIFDLPLGHNF